MDFDILLSESYLQSPHKGKVNQIYIIRNLNINLFISGWRLGHLIGLRITAKSSKFTSKKVIKIIPPEPKQPSSLQNAYLPIQ